jgi:hypothetical protein
VIPHLAEDHDGVQALRGQQAEVPDADRNPGQDAMQEAVRRVAEPEDEPLDAATALREHGGLASGLAQFRQQPRKVFRPILAVRVHHGDGVGLDVRVHVGQGHRDRALVAEVAPQSQDGYPLHRGELRVPRAARLGGSVVHEQDLRRDIGEGLELRVEKPAELAGGFPVVEDWHHHDETERHLRVLGHERGSAPDLGTIPVDARVGVGMACSLYGRGTPS